MSQIVRIDRPRRLRLADVDSDAPSGASREVLEAQTDAYGEELAELEDLLFYASQHAVLVVLQGRDTAGKDGAIRKILDYCNVQSSRVVSFKVPTDEELRHDFLWRVHAATPARGELVIFNRSHYEDVLVVRVHDLVPKAIWKTRYDAINDFESLLTTNRTLLFKFFLHISKNEQEKRLLAREADTEKAWKLSVGDWREREHWRGYTAAYEDALGRCASPHAPWTIVPADQKWCRNYIVLRTLVEGLRPYRQQWMESLSALGVERLAELRAFRRASP